MAEFVFTDADISINSVDLSDHVRQVTLNYEAETQDDTVMGDDTRSVAGGLKNWSMQIEFNQDFAAAKVDKTLFDIVGTAVVCVLKPTSGAVSATNPSFTGTGLIQNYNPMGGSVGDQAIAPVTIQAAGTLVRAEA